jgi:uncharacterized protein (DUF305 family)
MTYPTSEPSEATPEKADVSDPEIRKLCRQIIESQQSEIDQMKSLLRKQDS